MLIGLNGVAESGKDTVFGMLKDTVPYPFEAKREAFADRLKISAARALGWVTPKGENLADEIYFCNALKEDGATVTVDLSDHKGYLSISGREYLQRYGTEAHREVFDPDFWIKAVLPPDLNLDYYQLLVITDVRFSNEALAVHEHGGYVWQIDRPSVKKGDGHPSEQPLPEDLVDRVICNYGDLDDLKREVQTAWNEVTYV